MSRKGNYFLLMFSKDFEASDLIRSDKVVRGGGVVLEAGQEATYLLEMAKGRLDEVTGIVVATGLKKDLSKMHVSAEGMLIGSKGVGTRKQELEKRRMQQVNAQKLQLQQLAQDLADNGADAVCEQLQPVVKKPRLPCLPKKRNPDVMARIKTLLDELPCFIPSPSKSEVYKGTKIYVDQGRFTLLKQKFKLRPAALHRNILKLAVPEDILRLDGGCLATAKEAALE